MQTNSPLPQVTAGSSNSSRVLLQILGRGIQKRKQRSSSSPVDGRRSPVQRQDGRVVNDGAVLRVVDDIHGDELGAEGHHVELGPHRLIRIHHLRDGLSLHPPAGEFKHRRAVLLRRHGCKAGRRGLKDERVTVVSGYLQVTRRHYTGGIWEHTTEIPRTDGFKSTNSQIPTRSFCISHLNIQVLCVRQVSFRQSPLGARKRK